MRFDARKNQDVLRALNFARFIRIKEKVSIFSTVHYVVLGNIADCNRSSELNDFH